MRLHFLPLLLALALASLAGQGLPELGRWDTVAVFGTDGAPLDNPWSGGFTAPQFSTGDLDGDGVPTSSSSIAKATGVPFGAASPYCPKTR